MDRSAITLERLRIFVRVAERGNLSAVARELGVGQSTVTRQLRELEEAVGVSLITRTTRRVTMTDEGSRYYDNTIQILRLVEQSADEAREDHGAQTGSIRVSCTAALGVLHVSNLVFRFQDLYPNIRVDLSLNDQRVDLVREGIDVSLRLGPISDTSMKMHALGQCRRLLVASPAYLALRGTPADPSNIVGHEGIRMSNVAGSDRVVLRGPAGVEHTVFLDGRLRVDLALGLREALVAGRGIGHAHHWLVHDLLATNQLVTLLPEYKLPSVPLSMLILPERASIARVRSFIDFIAEHVIKIPGIEK